MQQVGVPPALDALGEGVDDCGCNGSTIGGGCASAKLVKRHKAGAGGAVQRRGGLRQLHKERALPNTAVSHVTQARYSTATPGGGLCRIGTQAVEKPVTMTDRSDCRSDMLPGRLASECGQSRLLHRLLPAGACFYRGEGKVKWV